MPTSSDMMATMFGFFIVMILTLLGIVVWLACPVVCSLCELERVELFRRSSEVAELIDRCAHGRKRERGKRCGEQGVQILNRAHSNRDVRAVMLSGVSGKVSC